MKQADLVIDRQDVAKENCWNVTVMYESWEKWEEDLERLKGKEEKSLSFPRLAQGETDLSDPQQLLALLKEYMQVDQQLNYLYTYAHLRHDEDVAEEKGKKAYLLAMSLFHTFQEEASWIDPSLLQLSTQAQEYLLEAKEMQEYRVYLRKILRLKPYTLPSKEEKLLAYAGRALETGHRAFSALNNADLKFRSCRDEAGALHELTQGTYHVYMKGKDRTLRKEAFTNLLAAYHEHENTLCELLQGQVQQHNFVRKARGFSSCLEASLYPHQVDINVYSSLIKTARNNFTSLHDYIELRKNLLGYSELHFYDLSVSVVSDVDWQFSYDEAVNLILESVACLGEEYQSILRKGLKEEQWVDRYENKRKRSGAYSSGCYGSSPYILLNYHGMLQDVMTLTHEAGHSMHSYLSRKHQKYQDHHYPIFLAEVASTFHEELLFTHLLHTAKTREQKAYLINQKIDDIRGTFFRQTLFAEFELKIHTWIEEDVPLTPALLNEEYRRLTHEYFGLSLTLDPQIACEWSRIPHFYYNFYVYQYATGLSAAHVLAKKVLQKEPLAREMYLELLSSGGSVEPLQALQKAGVDMRDSYAVESLLFSFQKWVEELRKLLT